MINHALKFCSATFVASVTFRATKFIENIDRK